MERVGKLQHPRLQSFAQRACIHKLYIPLSLSVCLPACLSACLSLCLSVSLSLCVSVSLSLSVSLCLSLSLSVSLSVSLCLSLSLSALCLCLSPSVRLCLCLSLSVSACLSVSPSWSVLVRLGPSWSVCPSVRLSVRLSACLYVYISACLHVCMQIVHACVFVHAYVFSYKDTPACLRSLVVVTFSYTQTCLREKCGRAVFQHLLSNWQLHVLDGP